MATRLETFMQSAKGLAIGGVIAAVLCPAAAQGFMADHVERRFQRDYVGGIDALAVDAYEERQAFIPFAKEIAQMKKREADLDRAFTWAAFRNSDLHWAIDSMDRLHDELASLIVDDEFRITPRQQVELLSGVMLEWLDEMKAERLSRNEKAAEEVIMVSAGDPTVTNVGLAGNWHRSQSLEEVRELETRLLEAAARIEEFGVENKRLQGILSGIATELDFVIRVAADPEVDIETTYGSFEKFTALLTNYNETAGAAAGEVGAPSKDEEKTAAGPQL